MQRGLHGPELPQLRVRVRARRGRGVHPDGDLSLRAAAGWAHGRRAGAGAEGDPACELVIPPDQVHASRIAATVLDTQPDAVNLRVDNRYGAWLRDQTGHTSTIRTGRTILLRPGQHLHLDPDAHTTLRLT